ncbi:MAG: hypothetical protein ACR2QW_03035, partial [bacterium]
MKLHKLIITVFVFIGALALAGNSAASTNCKKTFTSGETITKFEWCFSDDGTIAKLEHTAGLEHIGVGTVTEGY